jgi:nucleotide-binding universal stress UspA family protein
MMRPVIVPLDGSARSETTLPFAHAFGGGAPLVLMTTMWGGDASGPREYLEQTAAKLGGMDVKTTVIYDREPVEAILLVAEDHHPASMICMATHGRSGIGEAVLGSVASSVVRAAETPVMLVGPHVTLPSPTSEVLVAVDDRLTAAAITPAASALAAGLSVPITVIEVIAPPPLPLGPEGDRVESPGEGAALAAAAAALAQLGQDAGQELVQDPDPSRAIIDVARKLPASVVVMGTHARRGLGRAALGSVAMRVVHRAPCPVLVLRS